MTIYLLNLVLIGYYSLLYNFLKTKYNNYDKLKKQLIFLLTVQMTLILALRSETIGVDMQGYIRNFKYFKYYDFQTVLNSRYEIGYKLFYKFVLLFTDNQQVLLAVIAIMCIFPVGYFIYKNSKMPFLSFFIYVTLNYYSFTFSGVRQAIAISLILLSYNFIKQRKLFKFTLLILLATSFHKTALFFLPAYFLCKVKINKFTIASILFIDALVFVFRREVMNLLAMNFYKGYEVVETNAYTWLVVCCFILFLGFIVYKEVLLKNPEANAYYIFLVTGISIMLLTSVGTNVMRLADYYYIFVILFIPEIMQTLKDKKSIVLIGYIVILILCAFYMKFLNDNGYGIVPYKFFWE